MVPSAGALHGKRNARTSDGLCRRGRDPQFCAELKAAADAAADPRKGAAVRPVRDVYEADAADGDLATRFEQAFQTGRGGDVDGHNLSFADHLEDAAGTCRRDDASRQADEVPVVEGVDAGFASRAAGRREDVLRDDVRHRRRADGPFRRRTPDGAGEVVTVEKWDPEQNNVTVTVQGRDNVSYYTTFNFPKEGEVPMIIATDLTEMWNNERVSIEKRW